MVFHYGSVRPYHPTHLLFTHPPYIEALTLVSSVLVVCLNGTLSLSREAIGKVTEKGYAENPYEGGEVFLRLVGLVIEALGPQWGHLSTGILELKRQVAGLWIALEHEKQASLWDEVECPDVDEEDVPVRTQERSMQCSMKSEQTSHEAR